MTTGNDIIAATQDINHPLRLAYIEYVKECRMYGHNPLTFFGWVRENVDVEKSPK